MRWPSRVPHRHASRVRQDGGERRAERQARAAPAAPRRGRRSRRAARRRGCTTTTRTPIEQAVGEGLERHVDLPERRELAEPRDHRSSPHAPRAAFTSASSSGQRDGQPRGTGEVRPDAREHGGADDGHRHGGEQQRVRRDERERHEREPVQRADAGARRVQRARSAPVHQRPAPMSGSGIGGAAPAPGAVLTATAKCFRRRLRGERAHRRGDPGVIGAVIAHTGWSSPTRVAASEPRAGAELADDLPARVEQRDAGAVRARLGVDAARGGPVLERLQRTVLAQHVPRADDDAQRCPARSNCAASSSTPRCRSG